MHTSTRSPSVILFTWPSLDGQFLAWVAWGIGWSDIRCEYFNLYKHLTWLMEHVASIGFINGKTVQIRFEGQQEFHRLSNIKLVNCSFCDSALWLTWSGSRCTFPKFSSLRRYAFGLALSAHGRIPSKEDRVVGQDQMLISGIANLAKQACSEIWAWFSTFVVAAWLGLKYVIALDSIFLSQTCFLDYF